ncbi:MAG: NUDIX hydrolase [Candidatus Roizmanbacteria bacterium]
MPRNPLPSHAKKVFNGHIFDVYQWEQEMFDGSKAIFEKVSRPNIAIIIAVTEDHKIIIEHQDQPNNHGLISTPAGRIERGEDELVGAKRELLEETGYTSDDWHLWKVSTPNEKIQCDVHYFIARDCKLTGKQHLDAGEKIRLEFVDFETFLALSESDDFRDWILGRYIMQVRLHPDKLSAFRDLLRL